MARNGRLTHHTPLLPTTAPDYKWVPPCLSRKTFGKRGKSSWKGLKVVYKPDFVASPNRRGVRSFLCAGRCRPADATHLRERGPRTPLFGLAPGGVCRTGPFPGPWMRCLIFSPTPLGTPRGRLLSVALSPDHSGPPLTATCALWSPDFPLATRQFSRATSDRPTSFSPGSV